MLNFPPSADGCENSLLVSNSAHTPICTVKLKRQREAKQVASKRCRLVELDLYFTVLKCTAKESLEGPLRRFDIKPREVGMTGEQLWQFTGS